MVTVWAFNLRFACTEYYTSKFCLQVLCVLVAELLREVAAKMRQVFLERLTELPFGTPIWGSARGSVANEVPSHC